MENEARLYLAAECLGHVCSHLTDKGSIKPGHEVVLLLWAIAGFEYLFTADWLSPRTQEGAHRYFDVLSIPTHFAA
jgi:hypothetical protein